MRILITCDPEIPVPPENYGGIERIVDALITNYTLLGHEVYLVANPASNSKYAKQIYGWVANSSLGFKNIIQNSYYLLNVVKKCKPEIIHSFSRLLYLYPTLLITNVSILQSYQRSISPKSTRFINFFAGKRIGFTACAEHMFRQLPVKTKFTSVYNFTMTDYFIPDQSLDKEHLMFLGRIEDIKGTKECIEVALASKTKLIIAGNIQAGHDHYFNTFVKPHLVNPLIEYVGPVNDEQKKYFLQRAKAFLFPIKWEEPFGIVMAEAMACGVPVIGFRRGSVPEVVKNGETGFIVDNVDEMINAVAKLDQIDNTKVREDCVTRFTENVIARQYIGLLKKLIVENQ